MENNISGAKEEWGIEKLVGHLDNDDYIRLQDFIASLVERARREGKEDVLSIVERAKNAVPAENHPLSRFTHELLGEILKEARSDTGE